MRRQLVAFLVLFGSPWTWAGTSGYIMNGKTHVVYKDGKKVGQSLDEANSDGAAASSAVAIGTGEGAAGEKSAPAGTAALTEAKKPARAPASAKKISGALALYYEEDDLARCYFVSVSSDVITSGIFCVKKK